jgi:hypothetical protein
MCCSLENVQKHMCCPQFTFLHHNNTHQTIVLLIPGIKIYLFIQSAFFITRDCNEDIAINQDIQVIKKSNVH